MKILIFLSIIIIIFVFVVLFIKKIKKKAKQFLPIYNLLEKLDKD